jgi:hypothetical protein
VVTAVIHRKSYCLKYARGAFESQETQICRNLVSNSSCIQKHKIVSFQYKFWLRKVLIMMKPYLKLLPLHINRNTCQISSLCSSRGRLSGIELRTGWHSMFQLKCCTQFLIRATCSVQGRSQNLMNYRIMTNKIAFATSLTVQAVEFSPQIH